jgi:hypothetical protein
MWNLGQARPEPWRADVLELLRIVDDHPEALKVMGTATSREREETDWQRGPGWELFEPLVRRQFEHVQRMTAEDYVTFMSSWSFLGVLGEPERGELLVSVAAVLDRHGVREFDQHWRTDLYLTRRAT